MSRFKKSAELTVGKSFDTVNKVYLTTVCKDGPVKDGWTTKVGQARFIPLVDITQYRNSDFELIDEAVFTRFKYSFSVPAVGEDKGWRNVTWIDSSMRKSEGFAHNDPGIELGLDLSVKQRVNNPGFNGASPSKRPDNKAYTQEYVIPVLWNVVENEQQGIDDSVGEVAILSLTKFQFDQLEKVMTKNPPKFLRWFSNEGDINQYDFDGLGQSVVVDIDTGKGFDSYDFSLGVPASMDHISANVEAATDLMVKNLENVRRFEQGYWTYIEQNDAQTLSDEECDAEVFAWIANRLLTAWGHELADNTPAEDVIEAFNEVSGQYSLSQEVQIGNAIGGEEVIKPKRPGKSKTEKSDAAKTDDGPF